MLDTLAWMGVFLGFAALGMAGTALKQISALRKEVEELRKRVAPSPRVLRRSRSICPPRVPSSNPFMALRVKKAWRKRGDLARSLVDG
jgi:hypothetical protein